MCPYGSDPSSLLPQAINGRTLNAKMSAPPALAVSPAFININADVSFSTSVSRPFNQHLRRAHY
jgi:hypothetical protein